MKRSVIIALTVFYCNGTIAQEEGNKNRDYNHAIKLYTTWMLNPYTGVRLNDNASYVRQSSMYDYVHPSVAVMLRNRDKNYHELELTPISITSTELGSILHGPGGVPEYHPSYHLAATRLAVRYEFIVPLIKQRPATFLPGVGLAVMPYFSRNKLTPFSPVHVPRTTSVLGARAFIVPRLQINLSKRIFIDVNIPLCLADFSTTRQNIQNPTLPVGAQRYTIADVRLLPKFYTARLGVGVKI